MIYSKTSVKPAKATN